MKTSEILLPLFALCEIPIESNAYFGRKSFSVKEKAFGMSFMMSSKADSKFSQRTVISSSDKSFLT
jgi:hypothetical protein